MSKDKVASVAKIGIIYTLSNMLVKGMAFLTTPVFARLMTKAEFGDFGNISSWANIISIVVTLQLYVSIVRAKYDYKEDLDKYLSSILILGNIITLVWWGVIELNISFFENLFDMSRFYIRVLFIYALFSPAMQLLMYKNRISSKYKGVVALTWVTLVSATGGSVVLMLLMSNRLTGRVLGNYGLVALVDVALWIYVLVKGKCVSPKFWKYALTFSIPLIPHELAGQLLISSDRIIIKKLYGAEDAALYTLAYTISMMASVLLSSMNQAIQPWLYDKMEEGNKKEIRKISIPYTLFFAAGCVAIMLIGPEVVYIFGGGKYKDALYVIPPVCYGVMLQFIYTLYANVEFYEKKTGWISAATLVSAGINVGLNFLLIPIFGYIAAAYTTAIGFAFMVLFHCLVVRFKTEYWEMYNLKILLCILLGVTVMTGLVLVLYSFVIIRYIVILLFAVGIVIGIVKNKEMIKTLIKKR